MDDGPRRYEFGAATEDGSLLFGLRSGQLALVVGGLASAVLTVRSSPNGHGFGLALVLLLAVAATAFWPIRGRTIEEWAPTAARWSLRRLAGRDTQVSDLPLLGHRADGTAPQRPPETLRGLRLLDVQVGDGVGGRVGIVHDRRASTFTAVLRVRGRSFQLADTPEQERRLAAWAGVLTGLARASSPVHRIQWVESARPESGDAVAQYLETAAVVDQGHPARESYRALVRDVGRTTPRHETFLVVSIRGQTPRASIRQPAGINGETVGVLLREIRSLQRQLTSADITVDGLLGARRLAEVMRTAFDPAVVERARTSDDVGGERECDPSASWPLATETAWSACRTADTWHATYWIAQWPRTPVGADFLVPLLLGTEGIQRVAVTMEPVNPVRAHREVEQALLKQSADDELRSRAGFMGNARRRRARETVARREQELADGHADYRISGYVTVSAPTRENLEVRCGEVEQAASQAALDLQRLYGQQDRAFTYTLPLGRGIAGSP